MRHCIKAGDGTEYASLWIPLGLDCRKHRIISLVGAGGKTACLYELAENLSGMGKRVIVTTTTHIFCPHDRTVVLAENAAAVHKYQKAYGSGTAGGGSITVVGKECGGGKLAGLPSGETARLAGFADILLIEADGAKGLPVKVPEAHEPVIPAESDAVIACAGLDCIGLTLLEACFRPEHAAKLLAAAGRGLSGSGAVSLEHRITAEDLAVILTDPCGAKKGVDGRDYRIILNKADEERQISLGFETAGRILLRSPGEYCVLTSYGNK